MVLLIVNLVKSGGVDQGHVCPQLCGRAQAADALTVQVPDPSSGGREGNVDASLGELG